MPLKPPGEEDFDHPERSAPPPERRQAPPSTRQSPGRLPPPAGSTPAKRTRAGGMVPLEQAVKSGRLPGLQKGRKRSSIAKRFRSVIGDGPKGDTSSSDDSNKSIYDDDED